MILIQFNSIQKNFIEIEMILMDWPWVPWYSAGGLFIFKFPFSSSFVISNFLRGSFFYYTRQNLSVMPQIFLLPGLTPHRRS